MYLFIFRQEVVRDSYFFFFSLRAISHALGLAFRLMFSLTSLWSTWLASRPPQLFSVFSEELLLALHLPAPPLAPSQGDPVAIPTTGFMILSFPICQMEVKDSEV